jgi:hypothetical protein
MKVKIEKPWLLVLAAATWHSMTTFFAFKFSLGQIKQGFCKRMQA